MIVQCFRKRDTYTWLCGVLCLAVCSLGADTDLKAMHRDNVHVFIADNQVWVSRDATRVTKDGDTIAMCALSPDNEDIVVAREMSRTRHGTTCPLECYSVNGERTWSTVVKSSVSHALTLANVRWLQGKRLAVQLVINPSAVECVIIDGGSGKDIARYKGTRFSWDGWDNHVAYQRAKPHFRGDVKLPVKIAVGGETVYTGGKVNDAGVAERESLLISKIRWYGKAASPVIVFAVKRESDGDEMSTHKLVAVEMQMENGAPVVTGTSTKDINVTDDRATHLQIESQFPGMYTARHDTIVNYIEVVNE